MKVASNICRLLLGAIFTFSALVKANDPMGTIFKIEDYFAAWSLPISQDSALIFAAILMLIEFGLGILLILNLWSKLSAKIAIAFMAVMTVLTLWLALTNAVDDCGCFGDVIVLTNWQTFAKNVIFLAMATIVVLRTKQKTVYPSKAKCFLSGAMVVFCLFAAHSYFYLPAIDFSPYKIGSNINSKMELPPDGSMPEITDFYIESSDGDDITDSILNEESVCLLTAPFLQEASKAHYHDINKAYELSVESGHRFYCLTASSDEEIEKWQEQTQAKYPFARMDDVTLKTMVRSNPGLMVLNHGIVVCKFSNWQIKASEIMKILNHKN